MNRVLFFYLAVAGLLVSFSASSVADDSPDPQQFKQAAKENLNLSKIQPYILTATIVLSVDTNNREQGRITIYRDKDSYRSELEIGAYRELKWILNGKLRIARSAPFPVYSSQRLHHITELDVIQKSRFRQESTFDKPSRTTLNGVDVYCFDVKQPGQKSPGSKECFDATQKTIQHISGSGQEVWFSDYRGIGQQQFPGSIRYSENKHDTFEVRDIEIKQAKFDIASLPVPKDFLEFDFCEDMKPEQITKSVDPSYPARATLAHIRGDVILYSVIAKDGSVQDLKVIESPHPLLSQAAMDVVKQWRYSPPMCGAVPVSTEKEITVRFHMD